MKKKFHTPPEAITSNPETWKRCWLDAKKRSPVNRRERRGEGAEIERWNIRASSYTEHSESEESRDRREWITTWLESEGALQADFRVLDIGAGPGNYAAVLSRKVAEVAALEPAASMTAILKNRIRKEGIENIRITRKTWEEVSLEAEGWHQAFDLVFASMCPGVSTPDTLEKMVAASRNFCYLSGWSGSRWGKWGLSQSELWPRIFGEQLGDYPGDILYSFGLLYALGYRPELRFLQPRVHLEMDSEEAVEGLAEHLSSYTEITPAIRETVSVYVQGYNRMGRFTQEYTTCQGLMLWQVASRASWKGKEGEDERAG
jgi:SAM-dependent methyltransferase